ncbi:MAG: 7-carboxy-7-deazaguanine synthase [Fimbriimonadaceae bacterium]|nr:7-carboxy-7-deazaguanine synthase [Fimbriimonadaceae bacterium]
MSKLPIAETFVSVQGEGSRIGSPSLFIRVAGCNLRCTWCDTPYASWNPEGDLLEIDQLLAKASEATCTDVVLTGGEPMIFDGLVELTAGLKAAGKHITIETAGTVYRDLTCDLMSISPKLANSTPPTDVPGRWAERHDALRLQPDVLQRLTEQYDHQLKFVVQPDKSQEELQEIESILAQLPAVNRDKVFLMPEGTDAELLRSNLRELVSICLRHGFRLAPRLHIELFGNRRGT